MAYSKELVTVMHEGGCVTPTSHKLNQDGYFRKQVWVDGTLKPMMYHRHIWMQQRGDIPEGYEVDHICRNRACCNIDHLQLLTVSDHKVKTNKERSKDRIDQAYQTWIDEGLSGSELGRKYNTTESTGCRWVRKFKEDTRTKRSN